MFITSEILRSSACYQSNGIVIAQARRFYTKLCPNCFG